MPSLVSRETLNRFMFRCTNRGAPSNSPGVVVTAGSSFAQGSVVEIFSSAVISRPLSALYLWVTSGAAAGSARESLAQLFVDQAGGTNWTAITPEFPVSRAAAANKGGLSYWIPAYIKKGSALGMAVRAGGTTTGRRVTMTGYGDPTGPFRSCSYFEGVGAITNASGQVVTQGASGAEPGSWTLLGQLQRDCWWFELCAGLDDTLTNPQTLYADLGWSPINTDTDGSTITTILEDVKFEDTNTNEDWAKFAIGPWEQCHVVKGGSYLYCRASTDLATPESNFNVRALCGGG